MKNLTKKQQADIKKVIKLIKLYPAYNAEYLINMLEAASKNN